MMFYWGLLNVSDDNYYTDTYANVQKMFKPKDINSEYPLVCSPFASQPTISGDENTNLKLKVQFAESTPFLGEDNAGYDGYAVMVNTGFKQSGPLMRVSAIGYGTFIDNDVSLYAFANHSTNTVYYARDYDHLSEEQKLIIEGIKASGDTEYEEINVYLPKAPYTGYITDFNTPIECESLDSPAPLWHTVGSTKQLESTMFFNIGQSGATTVGFMVHVDVHLVSGSIGYDARPLVIQPILPATVAKRATQTHYKPFELDDQDVKDVVATMGYIRC